MLIPAYSQWILQKPFLSLTICFLIWKGLLTLVIASSPGPGYDTSTSILLEPWKAEASTQGVFNAFAALAEKLVTKLVRWDAVYFVTSANRGHLYEQEWAFGWGYTKIIHHLANIAANRTSQQLVALTGVLVSNVSHWLSVLTLHRLSVTVFGRTESISAFLAAFFHIISPAGVFLSAPYGESLFSLLNFLGVLAYCESTISRSHQHSRHIRNDLLLLLSGLMFGLASTIRGNGLLSGLIFLMNLLDSIWQYGIPNNMLDWRHKLALCCSGLMTITGFSIPQMFAYSEYCGHAGQSVQRPWCTHIPPSIYTFVQHHYWNVGFLRYWTLSNLPLFLLALPMLYLMFESSRAFMLTAPVFYEVKTKTSSRNLQAQTAASRCLKYCAVPQIILVILAFTSFHVQIITRISSGYPLLYIWMASEFERQGIASTWWIRWMIMYGIVQGGLYSSFLPPA